jgi:hypothetical protein
MKMNIVGKVGEEDEKKRWLDKIENDIRSVDVCIGYVENRDKQRFRTKLTDPK